MTYRLLVFISAVAVVGLAGCGHSEQTVARQSIASVAPEQAETLLLHRAQQTLREMHFVIDKYDIEAGYIRTRPLRGGQFFELWRQDNASAALFAQANFDSLRRTVEVFVEPSAQTSRPGLKCVVTVEKLSLAPQPIRGMSHLSAMYTDSNRRLPTLVLGRTAAQQIEWLDLGTDPALEQRIINRIQQPCRGQCSADALL